MYYPKMRIKTVVCCRRDSKHSQAHLLRTSLPSSELTFHVHRATLFLREFRVSRLPSRLVPFRSSPRGAAANICEVQKPAAAHGPARHLGCFRVISLPAEQAHSRTIAGQLHMYTSEAIGLAHLSMICHYGQSVKHRLTVAESS